MTGIAEDQVIGEPLLCRQLANIGVIGGDDSQATRGASIHIASDIIFKPV